MRVYTRIVQDADNDFEGCAAGNVRAAARVLTRRYDRALRGSGLRITQVALLAQLRDRVWLSATELADRVVAERSGVTRDLALLERSGLLTGRPRPGDRRVREVSLSTAGEAALRAASEGWRASQDAVTDALGPDRAQLLVALLADLVAALTTPGAGEGSIDD